MDTPPCPIRYRLAVAAATVWPSLYREAVVVAEPRAARRRGPGDPLLPPWITTLEEPCRLANPPATAMREEVADREVKPALAPRVMASPAVAMKEFPAVSPR